MLNVERDEAEPKNQVNQGGGFFSFSAAADSRGNNCIKRYEA
jgi:hypothetical protein